MNWFRRVLRKVLERRKHRQRVASLRKASQEARMAALRAELNAGVSEEQAKRDRKYLEGNENGEK